MLPWVYGFTWEPENVIFLSIFFTVAIIIATTFVMAISRALRDIKSRHVDEIRWHTDFGDLPIYAKTCRHVMTGGVDSRICQNGFDCRVCDFHAKFIPENAPPDPALKTRNATESVFGLTLKSGRMYHRGHTWVEKDADGTLKVGLDEFAQRVLGTPDKVELPEVGTRLEVNGTGWHIRKGEAQIRILSPVDGEVVGTGNDSSGYYLKVKPIGGLDLRHLLKGSEIRPWLMREIERLQFSLAGKSIGASLADGGELVNDLPGNYPDADWDSVLGEMFLEP